MGGNALSKPSARIDKLEYETIVSTVLTKFAQWSFDNEFDTYSHPVDSYRTKDSFGDADILYTFTGDNTSSITTFIKESFGDVEIVKNGDVTSFDFDGFQIDMIYADPESFNFARGYFAFNDLGNFIGRTAHALGFKFGHDGLKYILRDEDDDTRVVAELYLTQDFENALKFLGFDPEVHLNGFDTPEEIFEYAASSEYFDPATFVFGNRNHTARVRDKKRKMYNAALNYYKEKFGVTDESVPEKKDRKAHLERARKTFILFDLSMEKAIDGHRINKAYRSVVNGSAVSELTGLEGKDLGEVMKRINVYVTTYGLKYWISTLDENSGDDVLRVIVEESQR